MSKHIFVRPTEPKDAKTYVTWSALTKNNLFDPDVAQYRTAFAHCAYDHSGPLAYAPAQLPIMMEALAFKPGLDGLTKAACLKELVQSLITKAHEMGVGEIYFVCKDESTSEFAKRQAFEELPYRTFRMKIKDLERETNNIQTE